MARATDSMCSSRSSASRRIVAARARERRGGPHHLGRRGRRGAVHASGCSMGSYGPAARVRCCGATPTMSPSSGRHRHWTKPSTSARSDCGGPRDRRNRQSPSWRRSQARGDSRAQTDTRGSIANASSSSSTRTSSFHVSTVSIARANRASPRDRGSRPSSAYTQWATDQRRARFPKCDRSHKLVVCSVCVRSSVVAAEALALLFSCSIWPERSRELVRALCPERRVRSTRCMPPSAATKALTPLRTEELTRKVSETPRPAAAEARGLRRLLPDRGRATASSLPSGCSRAPPRPTRQRTSRPPG